MIGEAIPESRCLRLSGPVLVLALNVFALMIIWVFLSSLGHYFALFLSLMSLESPSALHALRMVSGISTSCLCS